MIRIQIGKLPVSRWEEYRRLRLRSLRTDPVAFSSSFGEESRHPPKVWRKRMRNVLFALSGGDPVGMISVVFSDRAKTKHVAFIYGVYVSPELRGQGIGNMLVEAGLSVARKNGATRKVELSVNPVLRAAVATYTRAGFKVSGRSTRGLKVGGRFYDLLSMELHIR